MDTLEVLKGLRKIFRHKNRWVKNVLYTTGFTKSKDAPTHPMQFNNKTIKESTGRVIYQVCIVGGIGVVCNSYYHDQPNPAFYGFNTNDLGRSLGFHGPDSDSPHNQLVEWNNNPKTTYKQFMARINKAINQLEKDDYYGSH